METDRARQPTVSAGEGQGGGAFPDRPRTGSAREEGNLPRQRVLLVTRQVKRNYGKWKCISFGGTTTNRINTN